MIDSNKFEEAIFFLDTHSPSINVLDKSTGMCQPLIENLGGTPDGIAIDSITQKIYWTNMGEDYNKPDGTIEVANLDGSGRRCLVGNGQITTPKQLYLDKSNELLYWSDREGARVMCCKTDGSELSTLIARPNPSDKLQQCVGITLDLRRGKFYWTQKGPSKGDSGRIFRANILMPKGENATNRSDIELLVDNLPEPIDLYFDNQNHLLYWTDRGGGIKGNSLNVLDVEAPHANYRMICNGFKEAIGLVLDRNSQRAYVADLAGYIYQVELPSGKYHSIYHHGRITGITLNSPSR